MSERRSHLLAILLNPPLITSGTRTRNAISSAGAAIGLNRVELANLNVVPTPTVAELNSAERGSWLAARKDLTLRLPQASAILAAWGVSGLVADARRARDEQVDWLCSEMAQCGIRDVWTVGGRPRHPSRWHQYVSDKHGRTTGGSFESRLSEVLQLVPTATLTRAAP